MSSSEDKEKGHAPEGGVTPNHGTGETAGEAPSPSATDTTTSLTDTADSASADHASGETSGSYSPTVDDPYNYYEDDYHAETTSNLPATVESSQPPAPPAPPSTPVEDDSDPDEDGMLRMSFLEHLEELRSRLIRCIYGLLAAYAICLTFSSKLFLIVSQPAVNALLRIGLDPKDAKLGQIAPMDAFLIIWVKLPLLAALFVASPWILYQVWGFIAPGLYKRERRWAAPFVISTAGLFILGGLFAYFVAFRFGLEFLLGIGTEVNVKPVVSVTEYFDLFVNVILGVGVVFELPILIFFLTVLRVASPRFLISHSRYAILGIVILAAVITPTPDVFNLALFSAPMIVLYFVGVFASYLLVLHREKQKFPWGMVLLALAVVVALIAGAVALAVIKYGFKLVLSWPFLVR